MEVEAFSDHGMRTGNVVCVPNAALLNDAVINETRILNYEWKEVTFELMAGEDWRAARHPGVVAQHKKLALPPLPTPLLISPFTSRSSTAARDFPGWSVFG